MGQVEYRIFRAGTLTLTGNNTFTGTLTVTLGTVILNDADGDTRYRIIR